MGGHASSTRHETEGTPRSTHMSIYKTVENESKGTSKQLPFISPREKKRLTDRRVANMQSNDYFIGFTEFD